MTFFWPPLHFPNFIWTLNIHWSLAKFKENPFPLHILSVNGRQDGRGSNWAYWRTPRWISIFGHFLGLFRPFLKDFFRSLFTLEKPRKCCPPTTGISDVIYERSITSSIVKVVRFQSREAPILSSCLKISSPLCCRHFQTSSRNFSRPSWWRVTPFSLWSHFSTTTWWKTRPLKDFLFKG